MNEKSTQTSPKPVLVTVLQILFRLILVLVAGIILGIIFYWAGASIYQNLVLKPNQVSQSTLDDLETRLTLLENQVKNSQTRFSSLETAQSQQIQHFSDLQTQLQVAHALLEDHSTSLEALAQVQTDLEGLKAEIASQTGILTSLTGPDSTLETLQMNVKILEAMELIERSRTYLVDNNAGSAKTDIESAHLILSELSAARQPLVESWLARLNLALSNLPSSPVLAASDLEIAWHMLADGLIGRTSDFSTISPTPSPTSTPVELPAPLP